MKFYNLNANPCKTNQTQNPGMEIEEEELPKVIDEALSNPATKFNLEISDDKSSVKLSMSFETYGMKMNWLFDCALESPEKVSLGV